MQVSYSPEKATAYQKKRQALTLLNLVLTPILPAIAVSSGLSGTFKSVAGGMFSQPHAAFAVYFLIYSLFILVLEFPFSFYSGFRLEHSFGLSNQTFAQWLKDFLKKSALSIAFMLVLMEGLYFLIWTRPEQWWVLAWAAFALVSYGIGKIFPVVIVPLFYKYSPVAQGKVRELILALAQRYGMPLANIYSLNLSKTTRKANAAFMGMGKTRRVVLSDTLLENFTPEEIEMVVAHELGHYKHRDIFKQLAFSMTASLAGFWVVSRALEPLAVSFGFEGASDIAAFPLISLLFFVFYLVLTPVQNGFSRWIETHADRFAYQACPKGQVFVECLEKLGRVNLSDPQPHPAYEWFFYDHPSIARRVRLIRSLSEAGA